MLEATKILVKAQLVVRLRRTTEARESSLIWDQAGGGTKQGGKNILALQTQSSLHATAGEKKHNAVTARLGGRKKCTPSYELGYLFLAVICGNGGFQNPQGTGERAATMFCSRMFVLSSVPPQQLLR